MEVYFILWLAKEVNGDYVSSTVEFATTDKTKAEQYCVKHQLQEQVMNVQNHMCEVRRTIIPVELDKEYKIGV